MGADDEEPTVYVRVDRRVATLSKRERPVHVLPWGWDETLGGVFSITFSFGSAARGIAIALLPMSEEPVSRLRGGDFAVVLLHQGRCAAAFRVRTRSEGARTSLWEENIDRLEAHRVELVITDAALLTARSRITSDEFIPVHDQVRVGWATTLTDCVWQLTNACKACSRLSQGGQRPHASRKHVMVFNAGVDADWELAGLVRAVEAGAVPNAKHFIRFFFLKETDDAGRVDAASELDDAFFNLLRLLREYFVLSGPWARRGRALPSLENFDLVPHDLGALELPEGYAASDFWPSAEILGMPAALRIGRMLGKQSVPFPQEEAATWLDRMPTTDDIEDAHRLTAALLGEAVEAKQWTIPQNAVVQMPIGPFTLLELNEHPHGDVDIVLRDDTGRAAIAYVEPRSAHVTLQLMPFFGDSSAPDGGYSRSVRGEAAIGLLLAALVRDFWVTEERQAVFARRAFTPRGHRENAAQTEPLVVYLPRIRYERELGGAQQRLQRDTPSAATRHSVRAHLRRAAAPSNRQLFLARLHGVDIPAGYTFVSPHERGGQNERRVIYRSRSALQLLSTEVVEFTDEFHAQRDWFAFEREIKRLLEVRSFRVEHTAASRAGDGGVDLFATKGDGLETVNWVIQAKYYANHRTVGVAVIRELVGTLEEYPRGTRAMVVATCRFSSDARVLAAKHAILLLGEAELIESVAGRR